jgi:cAMP phosphodiesterase
VKIQLLPTTFDVSGRATAQQHLACFVVDNCVALDAGSLAFAATEEQRRQLRDVVITHSHLDHIAGLPIFIDDLFETLETSLRVHATEAVAEALETHIFNWTIYPRFSELENQNGAVMRYLNFNLREKFAVAHLEIIAVPVNHQIETIGLIVSDKDKCVAITSDTAETDEFWQTINKLPRLDAVFVECAFPNSKAELAKASFHLTPDTFKTEIAKLDRNDCEIFAVHLKPMYRDEICAELESLKIPRLRIMMPAEIYEF